jgi:Immunoglobulin I-set domain/PQQ enzyme repeat
LSKCRAFGELLWCAGLGLVLSGCGGYTTAPAALVPPTITTQPSNQAVSTGQTATFAVAAAGTPPLSYQWQKNNANIAGATLSTYTTPATVASDNGATFNVIVTNSAGSVTSAAATLTANGSSAITITTHPVSQSVTIGQTATFSVTATSGTLPLSYRWQKNNANIAGATLPTYTTPATVASDNGATFNVMVTNSATSVTSASATLTVSGSSAITITTQPVSQSVTIGQTATFSVTATSGSPPLSYQWQKNGAAITAATSSSYTTPATTILDGGEKFTVVVTDATDTVTGSAATLTVNPSPAIDVVTYHNDSGRTGQNTNEVVLTHANVRSATFGKIGFFAVDGLVDAQPLYLSNVAIPGKGTHDVLYVVTENDSVYAFDATTGDVLWQVTALLAGETFSDDHGCDQVTPNIGITSTPVIDRTRGPHGAIYLVAMSKDASGKYYQRLHALDIATGAELFGGPTTIQATYPGTGPNSIGSNLVFDPGQYKERAGLLLLNGMVYTAWASHCDFDPYNGWIMGFNGSTLAMSSVLNITPNGTEGAIWMSGAGLAADSSGNIYFLDGNGTFDTSLNPSGFPSQGDFGNAFLKLSTTGGLAVADYFQEANQAFENTHDQDLGSGGGLVMLDLTDNAGAVHHLAVGAGKDANIYVVNRDSMGKYAPGGGNAYQEIDGILAGSIYSMPAYFNNTIYFGPVGTSIKAFGIANALLSTTPFSNTGSSYSYPGATPGISANGTANAILWAVENSGGPGVLHAYDAANLATELYNSNQAGTRDNFSDNKFITPTIANGKVYVGTPTGVIVFGLLP